MDKKFIKISLIICIPILLMVGFFTMTTDSINDESLEEDIDEISIKYNGYKETKNRYTISVLVKNNTKNIATLKDTKLYFEYKLYEEDNSNEDEYYMQDSVYIKGYEKDMFDEDKVYGIDPGCEKEILFQIPKGIKLDEKSFNLNNPIIDYNINFYKIRTGSNSLMLGSGGVGGSITLNQ